MTRGKVISGKIHESKMGYRGSKSVNIKFTVKEQRVEASSWIASCKVHSSLRWKVIENTLA